MMKQYWYENGKKEGMKSGMKKGEKRGVKKGAKDATLKIAKILLTDGMDIAKTLKITGLSPEDLKPLQSTRA